MNQEITESLLEDNSNQPSNKPKKNKKKTGLIIGIVVAILLLAGGGVFAYFFIQNQHDQEYKKQIELGNKYLDEGDYQNAELAFNEAISISDKHEDGYIGLAKADTYLGKVADAQTAYISAYNITEEPVYQKRANQVVYGNTNGNTTSGGSVAQQVDHAYIAETGVSESTIWDEFNGEQNVVTKVPVEDDKPIENLNVRGRTLYYLLNGKVYKVNLNDNSVTPIEIENVSQYMVYEDRIYFMTYNEDENRSEIIYTDTEGNNPQSLVGLDNFGFSFIIDDDNIYSVQTEYEDYNSTHLMEININEPTPTEVYTNEEALITGMTDNEDELYFKLTTSESYAPALYTLDTETKESSELIQPGSVGAMNIDDDNIYYVSNEELYKADLDGNNPELVSQIDNQETTDYYKYALNTINTTTDNIYVVNSLSDDIYNSVGLKNEVLTTNSENPEPLKGIELSGNTEELVDPQPSSLEAYADVISGFRNLKNGGSSYGGFGYSTTFSGYSLVDLNSDGIDELLIGKEDFIICFYTLMNGIPYQVYRATSMEDSYSITYDNYLLYSTIEELVLGQFNGSTVVRIRDVGWENASQYPKLNIDWTYF